MENRTDRITKERSCRVVKAVGAGLVAAWVLWGVYLLIYNVTGWFY